MEASTCLLQCCGMGEEGGARCNPLHSECIEGWRGERKGEGSQLLSLLLRSSSVLARSILLRGSIQRNNNYSKYAMCVYQVFSVQVKTCHLSVQS